MLLNNNYYQTLWNKYKSLETVTNDFKDNATRLTVNLVLDHYKQNNPIHINLQNSKETLFEIARHLFIELANDIYLNFYDLPKRFEIGDRLKRISDNQYYIVINSDKPFYILKQDLRKTKTEISPAIIQDVSYDSITKKFVKVDSGVSEKTIKNYFEYFADLNKAKSDFPRTNFDTKSIFISKKPLWDNLNIKSKIPSTYLPNPREESNLTITRSIPALADCMVYFTPKYEVCYQQVLLKNKKVKTIIIFDTEGDKIEQILQDKIKFGFNVIILSNSINTIKNTLIPCWNWFKEEIKIVNSL